MEQGLREIILKWATKAENDIKTARHGFNASEIITDTICFHCQQAAEKFLKAFLVSKNIAPNKTHKIELLLQECINIDPEFNQLEGIELLTQYAVELRYPDDFFIPDIDEAKDALRLTEKVKSFIMNKLNQDISE